MPVVRERNRPCFDHVAELGELLALLILRHRADDADMDDGNILGTLDQARDECRIIHHRPRVRHRCNRCIAACRACTRTGSKVLLRLLPRLAEMRVHIDEPGGDNFSGGIIDLGTVRAQIFSDLSDDTVLNEDITDFISLCGGVNHSSAL